MIGTGRIWASLPIPALLLDPSDRITELNPAAELLFHISNTRAVKKRISDLIINQHEFIDRLERSVISSHP